MGRKSPAKQTQLRLTPNADVGVLNNLRNVLSRLLPVVTDGAAEGVVGDKLTRELGETGFLRETRFLYFLLPHADGAEISAARECF